MSTIQPRRSARHQSRLQSESGLPDQSENDMCNTNDRIATSIIQLPEKLPTKLPGLTKKAAQLLHAKKQKLESPASQIHNIHDLYPANSRTYPLLKSAAAATLVFAQEEAVSPITNKAKLHVNRNNLINKFREQESASPPPASSSLAHTASPKPRLNST